MVLSTTALYRAYCRALIGVLWVHQKEIIAAPFPVAVVERLIHATARNPNPQYHYFDRHFPKFPSYLRRAAIMAALGQASSFSTRYDQWQGGIRKRRDALPPRRTGENALNPPLYRGQCIRFDEQYQHAEIKVWSGTDWIWTTLRIAAKRHRHEAPQNKALSPMLLADGSGVKLAIPFEVPVQFPSRKAAQRVCGVDLGIRKTATASIVSADGTVVARQFFHRGADIDRRDKGLVTVRSKARLTMGKSGTLSKGFCRAVYRKARHRNLDMAQRLSGEIVAFAQDHGAQVIVLEHLKQYRPRAGRKGSTLRQRFHGWLHSLLARRIRERAEESGLLVEFVNPAGTSEHAYDGSGAVKRDARNWSWVTFATGKRYNADLNACYNIAARFFAKMLGLTGRNAQACVRGKSSATQPRIPVTLSTLWRHAQAMATEHEAPTTAPA
ncbi:transposase, IS605 OrfB family protein, putative [Acidithiobacillus ferrooxidans ATCC 23270]|uniref:Transposase, IS605 OrfB family protein, putative n=2 Tax=Acidithiobacillus ferrooxidans TaxID=920 RepID=B7J9D3_ACIF2|nr:transposase, IS605 OrfB family protein, putative [Acidithiobacillus ferrooxidans ATCC 23270]